MDGMQVQGEDHRGFDSPLCHSQAMRRAEPDTWPERIVGLAILCPACFLAFGGAAVALELLAWIGGVL